MSSLVMDWWWNKIFFYYFWYWADWLPCIRWVVAITFTSHMHQGGREYMCCTFLWTGRMIDMDVSMDDDCWKRPFYMCSVRAGFSRCRASGKVIGPWPAAACKDKSHFYFYFLFFQTWRERLMPTQVHTHVLFSGIHGPVFTFTNR
jgi:hypothetical protein